MTLVYGAAKYVNEFPRQGTENPSRTDTVSSSWTHIHLGLAMIEARAKDNVSQVQQL